jgi:Fucose dissimilation pathway protein FucU
MLKGIPMVLSPELLETLAEMGHGDTITLGDAYFAAASMAKTNRVLRADGVSSTVLLDAILQLLPLDEWTANSVTVMGREDENGQILPTKISEQYRTIIEKYDPKAAETMAYVGRFPFYDLARKSFAVLATGEIENFGCITLQKGIR